MFYDNQDLNLKACELKIKELSSKAETLKLELLGGYSSVTGEIYSELKKLQLEFEDLHKKIENLDFGDLKVKFEELEKSIQNIDIEFIKIQKNDKEFGWGLKYRENDKNIGDFAVDLSYHVKSGLGAIGNHSFAEGYNTIAKADYSHAEGLYNIGKSETIHETGIGTSDDDRRNAFEIYKDGSLTAPELTFKNIFNKENSLITKEFNLMNYYKESIVNVLKTTNPSCIVIKDRKAYLVPIDSKEEINQSPISIESNYIEIDITKDLFFEKIQEINFCGIIDLNQYPKINKKIDSLDIDVNAQYKFNYILDFKIFDPDLIKQFLDPKSKFYYKNFINLYFPLEKGKKLFNLKDDFKENLRSNNLIKYDYKTELALYFFSQKKDIKNLRIKFLVMPRIDLEKSIFKSLEISTIYISEFVDNEEIKFKNNEQESPYANDEYNEINLGSISSNNESNTTETDNAANANNTNNSNVNTSNSTIGLGNNSENYIELAPQYKSYSMKDVTQTLKFKYQKNSNFEIYKAFSQKELINNIKFKITKKLLNEEFKSYPMKNLIDKIKFKIESDLTQENIDSYSMSNVIDKIKYKEIKEESQESYNSYTMSAVIDKIKYKEIKEESQENYDSYQMVNIINALKKAS